MKRVLIIDDKGPNEANSSINLVKSLTEEALKIVDFIDTAISLWTLNDNQDEVISIKIDLEKYALIFIHDSHDNPILKDPRLLIELLPNDSKLILFSGGRDEDLSFIDDENYKYPQLDYGNKHFEIRRSIYFNNFMHFIDSYLSKGEYKIEALFSQSFSSRNERAKHLFEEVKILLEESESDAVNSSQFREIFSLAGYNTIQTEKISRNYLSFDYQNFVERLEDEVTKIK